MDTVIVAHSGCGQAPNSRAYLNKIIHSKAHVIEIDINFTKDQKLVLFHDDALEINGVLRKIDSLTLEELKKHDDQILDFYEALDIILEGNQIINLDIKSTACLQTLIRSIHDKDILKRVIITGCHRDRVEIIREIDKEISIIWSPSEHLYKDVSESKLLDLCHMAVQLGCSGINIDYRYINKSFVDYAKKRGLSVFVWTLNDLDDVMSVIKQGVSSITVNKYDLIDILYKVNKEKHLWLKDKQKGFSNGTGEAL
ncbi:glycerophosphodiester phosphodiesterase [Acidaminobacter sp. JC074]|uniref:glycerophosphodiester phosphodiesterase n=1 Tax=Acidaminobacter sp. JC074 TaxID=2530199 RepID=UPI001F104CD5